VWRLGREIDTRDPAEDSLRVRAAACRLGLAAGDPPALTAACQAAPAVDFRLDQEAGYLLGPAAASLPAPAAACRPGQVAAYLAGPEGACRPDRAVDSLLERPPIHIEVTNRRRTFSLST
jgi:hypothetical protein